MTHSNDHVPSISVMPGAHGFHIDHLVNNINIQEGRHGRDLKPAAGSSLASNAIANASYLRDRKRFPPDSNCMPGTRKTVIKDILTWAKARTLLAKDDSRILWLYGYVGCGKSSISQAISEELARQGRLGASFFFFRGSGDRSRTTRFATTVAIQLARAVPFCAPFIEGAFRKHPGLSGFSLHTQFKALVYDPFLAATRLGLGISALVVGPVVIVIDGLDECEDHEEVSAWIDQTVKFFDKHPLIPLRILIASRVEEHIQSRLQSIRVKLVDLVDHSPDADIALVMRETFREEMERNRILQALDVEIWPSLQDQAELVRHIKGSFIFMRTIVGYILEPDGTGFDPTERLQKALKIDPGLDGLYTETLARAEGLPHFHDVIWTICLPEEPISINALAELLQIQRYEVIQILIRLHSILHVPGLDTLPVTVCHISLVDFLTTKTRSGRFAIPPSFSVTHFKRCMSQLLATWTQGHPTLDRQVDVGSALGYRVDIIARLWTKARDALKLDAPLLGLERRIEQRIAYYDILESSVKGKEPYSRLLETMTVTALLIYDRLETKPFNGWIYVEDMLRYEYQDSSFDELLMKLLEDVFGQLAGSEVEEVSRAIGSRLELKLLYPSRHAALANMGREILLTAPQHAGYLLQEYMVLFWPSHLRDAVAADEPVQLWTTGVSRKLEITFGGRLMGYAPRGRMQQLVRSTLSDSAEAKKLLRRKYPEDYNNGLYSSAIWWGWDQRTELLASPAGPKLSIINLLDGLEMWLQCYFDLCNHQKAPYIHRKFTFS